MKLPSNSGKNSVYIGSGQMVNKLRIQVLVYPGKPFVSLGFGGNGKMAMFLVFNSSTNS